MNTRSEQLGDFTTTARVMPISMLAIGIGLLASFVAWFLLKLIGLFTNLFYYQRINTALSSPAGNHLGLFAIAVPVIGALIVGLRITWLRNKWRHPIGAALDQR